MVLYSVLNCSVQKWGLKKGLYSEENVTISINFGALPEEKLGKLRLIKHFESVQQRIMKF